MAETASFKNGDTPRLEDRHMDFQITIDDREKIEAGIREKYSKVAINSEGQFKYPSTP